MTSDWDAIQADAIPGGANRIRERFQRDRAEKQRQREEQQRAQAAQQAIQLQQASQEDGEIIEDDFTLPAVNTGDIKNEDTSDDEIVVVRSGPKVKESSTTSDAAKKTGQATELAKLKEREAAAAADLAKVKESSGTAKQQNGAQNQAAARARQAELREKLTTRPKASNDVAKAAELRPKTGLASIPRIDTSALNGRQLSMSDVTKPKRSEPSSGFSDERRSSKKPQRGSGSNSSSALSSPRSPIPLANERQPPDWYEKLNRQAIRSKGDSGVDVLLNGLKTQIKKAQEGRSDLDSIFKEVRGKLHTIPFYEVTAQGLKNTRILDNENGLPQIFDKRYARNVDWPWDIRADAEELYNKWCRKDFLTDLMRGIQCGKPKNSKEVSGRNTDRIDPTYPKLDGKDWGNMHLLNGQWWPTQLTCVRDGAHAESQAGISGGSINQNKQGAYSCVMSGGHGYGNDKDGDQDGGDEVLYCGTDCTDGSGKITDSTQHMINSANGTEPVRLIRSHHLKSEWAPKVGYRYDGLYDVVDYERLDPVGHPRARHRFKLVRQKNQDPIRWNEPEKRPTDQEVEAYQKDKRLRGF